VTSVLGLSARALPVWHLAISVGRAVE
jgi:hypothetical protein